MRVTEKSSENNEYDSINISFDEVREKIRKQCMNSDTYWAVFEQFTNNPRAEDHGMHMKVVGLYKENAAIEISIEYFSLYRDSSLPDQNRFGMRVKRSWARRQGFIYEGYGPTAYQSLGTLVSTWRCLHDSDLRELTKRLHREIVDAQ